MREKASEKTAVSEARRISQARARPIPTPMAWPFTAAMLGFCNLCSRRGINAPEPGSVSISLPSAASIWSQGWFTEAGGGSTGPRALISWLNRFTLAPEQKDGSRPVSSSTRSPGSLVEPVQLSLQG